jgi:hypothetical protein
MEMLFVLGLFGGLAIAGCIGYFIGRAAGDARGGLVWGLLLGPIGWLVVLLKGSTAERCRKCRGPLKSGARCSRCGTKVQKAPVIPPKAVDPFVSWANSERNREAFERRQKEREQSEQ